MFVNDFLDLLIEVLPAFDQGLRPALPDAVEIFLLEPHRNLQSVVAGPARDDNSTAQHGGSKAMAGGAAVSRSAVIFLPFTMFHTSSESVDPRES